MSVFRRLMLQMATALLVATSGTAFGAEKSITLASTTSTDNSGLFAYLLPIFEAESGIRVDVVAVGTGQAIRLAKAGDADVLLIHDKPSEETFVAEGFGVERRDVMYNDFVIVGPANDPAGIKGGDDAVRALRRIEASGAPFASRGDDSGTNKAELRLWKAAGIDPADASGTWYRETGSGMGPTLNTASSMNAYTLTDRATWLSFKNPGELELVVEGDRRLFNQYGVILVNPVRHPHVKAEDGQAFVDWITSAAGQKAIGRFGIGSKPLFFPNAMITD
ncbi:MAG: extracellular solute-binding protein [Alphaproteobacteria bacterium]|nr:extracellular solute-binding protein [Alphaproteobacteria bacterium]